MARGADAKGVAGWSLFLWHRPTKLQQQRQTGRAAAAEALPGPSGGRRAEYRDIGQYAGPIGRRQALYAMFGAGMAGTDHSLPPSTVRQLHRPATRRESRHGGTVRARRRPAATGNSPSSLGPERCGSAARRRTDRPAQARGPGRPANYFSRRRRPAKKASAFPVRQVCERRRAGE